MRRRLSMLAACAALVAGSFAAAAHAQADPPPPPRPVAPQPAVEETPAAWKKLAPAGGGFTALIPGTASEQTTPIKFAGGELTNHIFALETPLAAYIVSYADFPQEIADPEAIKRMLDGGRDSGLASTSATLRNERDIKIDGHPGREWVMAAEGKFVATARAYWVTRRLYQTVMVVSDAVPNPPAATVRLREAAAAKFLNSFALTAEAPGVR